MIVEPPTVEKLGSSTSKIKSPRPRVLVADDHQVVLKRVVSFLQNQFEVIGTATDGLMLIQEALRLQPDIIVSDILMPGVTGIQAAHQLREQGCKAKFVFMSVYESGEFVRACFDVGASGYVFKARMGTDLVIAIQEALLGNQFISGSPQTVQSQG